MSRVPEQGKTTAATPGGDGRAAAGATTTPAATGATGALDALPYPVIVVRRGSGTVLFANRAATDAALVPGTPQDGRPMTDGQGRPLAPHEAPLARAAAGEVFSDWRVGHHGPPGGGGAGGGGAARRAAYLASARPVPRADDSAVAVSFVDVTDAESVEAELRESLHARDEFVSVATHELKEPLASILLSLQLLEMLAERGATVPADEILSAVGVIRRQGDRLARLIENLLDVSRINNDRLRLDPEALDVCDVVRDCVEHFRDDAARAGSALTFNGCASCIGYFDRLRLEQVVSNLLSNAIKYGAGRPVEVRLEATDNTVVFEVADQGIGIAPADQQRVFERFERATKGHLRRSLGLGLYIVRSVVEAHGGTVRLHSEVGRGSTFTVQLPRRRMPDRGASGAGGASGGGTGG